MLAERLTTNGGPVNARGRYVLYWMIAARRTRASFALDRALELCKQLDRPLVVFEPLRASPALIVHLAHDITASRQRRALFDRLRETAREITQLVDNEHHLVPVPLLTQQEQRVLGLFAQGRTPAQVAKELGISSQTLRNHLYHVNRKLGTHTRLEAVIHAVRRGLI